MNKLTLENIMEEIRDYTNISSNPNTHVAVEHAEEALRFQERHQWKDIKKEKPPETGGYLVWVAPHGDCLKADWLGSYFDEPRVIYWAHIMPEPPKED